MSSEDTTSDWLKKYAENKEAIDANFADNSVSKSEENLIKLLKKLDPWNSGFWKIHLEEVKREYFQKGYDFSAALNINKQSYLEKTGIEIKGPGY